MTKKNPMSWVDLARNVGELAKVAYSREDAARKLGMKRSTLDAMLNTIRTKAEGGGRSVAEELASWEPPRWTRGPLHRYRCSGCGAVLCAPHCPKHGETTVERLEEDEK